MNEISFHAAANLTAEPELRYTPSARPVAQLRLAVNSRRRSAEGEWVDAATTFLDATVWGEQGERAAS
jgi:single-strand DNA-binding protein